MELVVAKLLVRRCLEVGEPEVLRRWLAEVIGTDHSVSSQRRAADLLVSTLTGPSIKLAGATTETRESVLRTIGEYVSEC